MGDIADFVHGYVHADDRYKIKELEERIKILEKMVYELQREFKKANSKIEKKFFPPVENSSANEDGKDYAPKIGDRIQLKETVNVDNRIIESGKKGRVDNRIRSSDGTFYEIIFDGSKKPIRLREDCIMLVHKSKAKSHK